ncbi:hypothetical protein DH2020_003624 [Rehmannia glutinosa]|uniref:Large ribosomal subunit protein uL18 C-terminal eukaryotes domain-containing protein n=1 Tax=Rehmannia glutinosa TaxID=99300 RepID=A0ABR0XMI7_REHGL
MRPPHKGVEADNIEEMYKKVHAAICANPLEKKSQKQPPKEHKRFDLKKLTYEERKSKLIERLNALNAAAGTMTMPRMMTSEHQN